MLLDVHWDVIDNVTWKESEVMQFIILIKISIQNFKNALPKN